MKNAIAEHPSYDPLMTSDSAAQYLGMNPETLLRLARTREIACVRMTARKGSPVKFRLSTLNSWIRRHEQTPMKMLG